MIIPTASEILKRLQQAKPQPTSAAPGDARGIYGLFDHTGTFRYIGSTSSKAETLRKRIHQRHRTGSETHSHYFAQMYNTGRMWVDRTDPETVQEMKIVRSLRQAFIERHCGCTWVTLPDHVDIAELEAQVITLAPPAMVAWNRRGMAAYDEPVDQVDALIEHMGLSAFERAALNRQRERFHGRRPVAKPAVPQGTGGVPALPKGPFRFFALDVETANNDRGSICQVGVACVRPDDSIETWVTLVDPRTRHWMFSGLHGITESMVQGAPTIGTVIDALDGALSGHTVYQHSGFDRSAVRAACATLDRAEPAWTWQDSVSVARRAWPELKSKGGHGLASLKAHLGLRFEHHDAGEDARAAAEVVLLAERGARGTAEDVNVLDDGDIERHVELHPVVWCAEKTVAPASALPFARFGPAAEADSTRKEILVPVAADGSHFGPHLARNGRYTVGAKGTEVQYEDFDAALMALREMDKPRWRRPNEAGNWGIVSGRDWTHLEKR